MSNSTTPENRFRFTKKSLLELATGDRNYQVSDTESRGLILLVTPNGVRTFYRYGRVFGRVQRIKIGVFPAVSVVAARKKCDGINGRIAEGKAIDSPSRGGLTFGDLWTSYWNEHATVKKAEASRESDKWQWERMLRPSWRSRKVAGIKKADVLDLQTKTAKTRGKVSANRLLSLVKKIFNHAIEAERIEVNPAATVKKYPEQSRERFLQGDELPKFFKALDEFDNPDVADFWRICLFTGARQTNVLEMRWKEIDFKTAVWTIPKTKGNKQQAVPLVAVAIELLEGRRNRSEYVFASHGKTKRMTRPGKAWDRLLEQAGLENLTMHDLRRSLGSYQAAGGTSELIIGKTLGHAPGSKATSIYARVNLNPVRQAMEDATDAMIAAAKPDGEGGDE